jgi:hypothetical protein
VHYIQHDIVHGVPLNAEPITTACRRGSHNEEQPSHADRWVPSYVGHCTFLPNSGNYQQNYTASLPGTRKSTTFKCIFFGAPALGCASKSLVTLVAQQPYKRRDLVQVICHAVRDGMLTHVSSPPPDADTFIPIYSYRRCNLLSPNTCIATCRPIRVCRLL